MNSRGKAIFWIIGSLVLGLVFISSAFAKVMIANPSINPAQIIVAQIATGTPTKLSSDKNEDEQEKINFLANLSAVSSEVSYRISSNAEHTVKSTADLLDQVGSFFKNLFTSKPQPEEPLKTIVAKPKPTLAPSKTAAPALIQQIIQPQTVKEIIRETQIEKVLVDNSQFLAFLQEYEKYKEGQRKLIAEMSQITNVGPRGNIAYTVSNPTFTGTAQGLGDDDIPDDITVNSGGAGSFGSNLSVGGDLTVGGIVIDQNGQITGAASFNDKIKVGTDTIIIDGVNNYISSPSNALSIYTTSTPLAISALTATSTFSSRFTGNLGIGTTSPGAGFSVQATSTILGGSTYIYGTSSVYSLNATATLSVASSSPGNNNLAVTGHSVLAGNVTITGALDIQGACVGCGSPGGQDTQVQFNSGSSFTGDSGLVYSSPSLTIGGDLSLNGSDINIGNGISATSTISGEYGKLGFGTTSPFGQFAIEATTIAGSSTPIFVVGDQGTSSPLLYVSGVNGNVGVATDSPAQPFSVDSNAYIGSLGVGAATTSAGGLFVKGSADIYDGLLVRGGKLFVGTTTQTAGTEIASFENSTNNANTLVSVYNENSGNSVISAFRAANGELSAQLTMPGTGFTGGSGFTASRGAFSTSAGMDLITQSAATIRFLINQTEKMQLNASGVLLVGPTTANLTNSIGEFEKNGNDASTVLVRNTTQGTAASAGFQNRSDSDNVIGAFNAYSTTFTAANGVESGAVTLESLGTGNTGIILNVRTEDPIKFKTNATERARFLSTGEFGIGRTGPSVALDVVGTTTVSSGINILGSQLYIGNGKVATSSIFGQYGNLGFASSVPYGQFSIESDEDVVGSSTPIFVIGDQGTSTSLFTVSGNNGFIGIATNTPGTSLSVNGPVVISGSTASAELRALQLYNTSGTNNADVAIEFSAANNTTGAKIVGVAPGSSDQDLAFYVTDNSVSSELVRFQGDGEVGIGLTDPLAKLHVSGGTNGGGETIVQIIQHAGSSANDNPVLAFGSSVGAKIVQLRPGGGESRLQFRTNANGSTERSVLTLLGNGNAGFGRALPDVAVDIVGTTTVSNGINILGRQLYIGNGKTATSSIFGQYGNLGFASSVPYGQFSIESDEDVVGSSTPIFVIGDQGTSSPLLYVSGVNGNVGVATDSPAQPFSVDSNAYIGSLGVGAATTSAGGLFVKGSADIYDGLIVRGGKVGIGTAAPQSKLQVEDSDSKQLLLVAGIDATGKAWAGIRGARQGVSDYNSYLGFFTAAGSTGSNSDVSVERVRIDNNGNLGIGTTTPGARLAVEGFGVVKGNWNVEATSTVSSLIATSTLSVGTTTPGGGTGNTNGLYVQGNSYISGNLGIGIATPGFRLQVVGASGDQARIGDLTFNSTEAGSNAITAGTNFGSNGNFYLNASGGEQQLGLFTNGNVGIGTTTVPAAKLEVAGGGLFKGNLAIEATSTVSSLIATSTLEVRGSLTGGVPDFVAQEGRIAIGSSTPYGQFSVEATAGIADANTPIFVIGDQGTTTPIFYVSGIDGSIGIGTDTPQAVLAIDSTKTVPALMINAGGTGEGNVAISVEAGDLCNDGTANTTCALNDVAELFPNLEQLEPGDVVSFDENNAVHLRKASVGQRLAGVISTSPAIVFEGNRTKTLGGIYNSEENRAPLALAGRVPVKVNLEGGEIKIGDPITISSVAGVGKKATESGQIVGYALQNLSSAITTPGGIDKILILTDRGYWMSEPENTTEPSWLAQVIDKISNWLKDAIVAIKEIITDKITTKQLCVGETCVNEDQLKALLTNSSNNSNQTNESNQPSDQGTNQPSNQATDSEPPAITLNGLNPTEIEIGVTYSDLGVTVSDNLNQNLGYKVKLDEGPEIYPNELVLDTSAAGEHIITFIAVDQSGNIGTATRTVKIIDPNTLPEESPNPLLQDASVGETDPAPAEPPAEPQPAPEPAPEPEPTP